MLYAIDNVRASTALAALALCACTGGGSQPAPSSSSSIRSTPPITNVLVDVSPSFVSNNDILGGVVTPYRLNEKLEWEADSPVSLGSQIVATVPLIDGQLTMLEYSGGCYNDRSFNLGANGQTVQKTCMFPGQRLRIIIDVNDNTPKSLYITPFTELASALTNYQISKGVTPLNATQLGNGELSSILGFDVRATSVASLSASTAADSTSQYAAMLLGIGTWIRQKIQNDGGVSLDDPTYSIPSLVSLMSSDIAADGKLDGLIAGHATTLGKWILTGNDFRHEPAAYASRSVRWLYDPPIRNKQGLSIQFLPVFVHSNDFNDGFFGTLPPVPLSENGPVLTLNSLYVTPTATLDYGASVTIDSIVGVPIGGVRIYVDDELYDQPLVPHLLGLTNFFVNTTIFRNGPHKVTVSVTDNLGMTTSQFATITFTNDCVEWPRACL